jgi:S-DNA-T family DNA segregation ATPase FtsK/SpoIIIE
LGATGYFIGPWVFFPFFIYCFTYGLIYSRRDNWGDSLAVFFLAGFFLSFSFSTFPVLLGDGINFLLSRHLPILSAYLLSFIFLLIFLFISFRRKPLLYFAQVGSLFSKTILQKIKSLEFRMPFREKEDLEKQELSQVKNHSLGGIEGNQKPILKKEVKKNDGIDYHEMMQTVIKKRKKINFDPPSEEYFEKIISRLEKKLREFKIDGRIINVLKGPVVDTLELELGPGVKLSRVNNHAQDLSLALFGVPLRIVYPLKGRSTVGIEVPRTPRETIHLGDIILSDKFQNGTCNIPLSMGRDTFGEVFVADLASMPHMLVAGVTGAGKSVFINALLFSLLIKRSPDTLKLILIDPKQLELAIYTKLPHLIMPVITESDKVPAALKWAIREMERRYEILKVFGVRNIESFNEKLSSSSGRGVDKIKEFYPEDNSVFELPYLVIIIDEFADLILSKFGKDIETSISRLAAKARAAGIHLILATQRPSVDVITGLIKSNFPTRVSFRVSTGIDSRTILNTQGAENLLGQGDMLFKSGIETRRIHGALVSETELEQLIKKFKGFECCFDDDALSCLQDQQKVRGFSTDVEDDGLLEDAMEVIQEHKSVSVSLLQRRLKIGYNRAANLMEKLEQKGLVGSADGSKPRRVLSGDV